MTIKEKIIDKLKELSRYIGKRVYKLLNWDK